MRIYAIGYARKSAEEFFGLLRDNRVEQVVDVRLKNTSQLTGFTKKRDLIYFLKELLGIDYLEAKMMAPTNEILIEYRKTKNWGSYEKDFTALLKERNLETNLDKGVLKESFCLLCSEAEPAHCHRRLVAEHIKDIWTHEDIEIIHL